MLCQRWFSLVQQCVLISCVSWFRTGAVYMPGGAMSAVSCSGSLSDPWAPPPSPPPPLPIMSMQAYQDWCEGLWQWIHLSVVFVCVYNDHWNCWSEKCEKRYTWLQAIQVSGYRTYHLYWYLHWNCTFVFVLAHIFSYTVPSICICVFAETISHTVNKIASLASRKSFWGQDEPSFPRQLTIQLDLKFPPNCQHKENLSF